MGPKKSVEVKFFTVAFLEGAARHQMVPGVFVPYEKYFFYWVNNFRNISFYWSIILGLEGLDALVTLDELPGLLLLMPLNSLLA